MPYVLRPTGLEYRGGEAGKGRGGKGKEKEGLLHLMFLRLIA